MLSWLQTKVFPEAVQAQSFGSDVKKFVKFEQNNNKGSDQFASDVVFGTVTVENESGKHVSENVIIKVQPSTEIAHKVFDCDGQFHNEVFFYTKVIPFLRKYDTDNILSTNFCKFVYGKATCGQNPKDDIMILKTLNEEGFKLTDERLFIDEKHINLALDRIGKYHALSFKAQAEDPQGFRELVSQIKTTHRDEVDIVPCNFLTLTTQRGINAIKDEPKYKHKLARINKHCEKAEEWRRKYEKASESLNVLTHGDFCRNNMMFKYDTNGDPIEVVFFDMATIKYCSPIVDLSFFLSLNTSPDSRRLHWDEFLRAYYSALSRQLDGHPTRPPFEVIELEMRKKGIYGYYLCSFFLPSMIEAKTKEDWDKQVDEIEGEEAFLEEGGPKATEYLAELVRHMLDKNYIFDV